MRLAVAVSAAAALLAPQAATALSPGSFAPTGSMTHVRNGPGAAPLSDGRVLVAGGNVGIGFSQDAELYDPAGGSFSATGLLGSARFAPAAASLPDGRVLVAGGFNGTYFETAELYDPATGAFSATGMMGAKRIAAAAAPLPDGRVLVAGGFDGSNYLQSAELYDPGTGTFSPTGPMTVQRFAPAAAPLPDGRVLVAGGYYFAGGDHWLQSAEIYDPATGSFSPTGAMAEQREGPAAAPLPDGRVLVAGGTFHDGVTNHYLQSAELYDPSTGSFTAAGAMTSQRYAAGAAPLPDGRVLVAGGNDGTNRLQSAELFSLGPRAPFAFRLRGKSLIFTAPVAGTVTVSDAAAKSVATAAKKKKKGLSLKSVSASGGAGQITVALKLTGKAKQRFKTTGKVKVKAKISFAPRAECVARFFKSCQDRGTDTAKLKIKKKAKKK
jgi:hypothetical protein